MIGKREFCGVLITLTTVKLLLSYPLELVKTCGNAAWIEMLFITALCLLLFWLTVTVYERKANIIELADMYGGRTLRIIIGLIVFVILSFNMVAVLRIFPESVKIILLPETDTDVITGVCVLTVIAGALIGIRSAARINYIFLPICGAVLAAFVIMLFSFYRTENILPILGTGAKDIFLKGIGGLSFFSDIIVLNLLLGHAKNLGEARSAGFKAIITAGAAGTLLTLVYCLVYPYPVSEEFILPIYQLTRMINLSSFFNRFEALFHFIWSILVFFYGTIYLYMICFVWQTTFRLKYIKPLVLPAALLVSGIALIPDSIIEANELEHMAELACFPAALLLPAVMGAVDKIAVHIKNKKESEEGNEA